MTASSARRSMTTTRVGPSVTSNSRWFALTIVPEGSSTVSTNAAICSKAARGQLRNAGTVRSRAVYEVGAIRSLASVARDRTSKVRRDVCAVIGGERDSRFSPWKECESDFSRMPDADGSRRLRRWGASSRTGSSRSGFRSAVSVTDRQAAASLEQLTARERDVLRLVGRGSSNRDIASALFVSEATVKSHVGHIFTKLGVRDRPSAIVFAFYHGLVDPQPD